MANLRQSVAMDKKEMINLLGKFCGISSIFPDSSDMYIERDGSSLVFMSENYYGDDVVVIKCEELSETQCELYDALKKVNELMSMCTDNTWIHFDL